MEKDRLGRTFEEIEFFPERGNRYSYCIPGQCLLCTRADCKPPDPGNNACSALVPPQDPPKLSVCAVAELGEGKLDVWLIDPRGELENVRNGCQ